MEAYDILPSVTPHEAVPRSKLEGVVKTAYARVRKTRSVEGGNPDSGCSSEHLMASSRNGEGDFFFRANGDVSIWLHCSCSQGGC